jgi:integrase
MGTHYGATNAMVTLTVNQPWQDPRTGIWKLRKRIPQRYRAVAGQRGDTIKLSTGTADRHEAKRRWPDLLRQWGELEAQWERRLNLVVMTHDRAKEVTARWVAHIAAGGRLETGGADSELFEVLDIPAARTTDRVSRMWQRVDHHADEALRLMEMSVTPDTKGVLVREMLSAVHAAYLQADLRALGAVGTQPFLNPLAEVSSHLPDVPPPLKPVAPVIANALPMSSLLAAWKITSTTKPTVVTETEYAVASLIAFAGSDEATLITRELLVRWRDSMKAAGRTNATWNNRLSLIRQVLVQAVRDDKLPADPTDRLRLQKNAPQSWLPYSDQEAVRILEAARQETQPTRRWAHWIMAFTGMRVGEVLQLSGADIREDDGIAYFAIHQDDPEKSVKNSQRRNIPVHSALVAEGLLRYVRSLPAGSPLFPDKALDKHGRRGGRGWNVVGKWVRVTVGINDARKAPDHSWRHRMEDELRNADVPEDVRDAIAGHARKTVGRIYGVRGESLRRLSHAIKRLKPPRGLPPAAQHPAATDGSIAIDDRGELTGR